MTTRISNCLVFALAQLICNGGYLVMRRSRFGPFPHFIWTPDLVTFHEFVPVDPRHRWIPPLAFVGMVLTFTADSIPPARHL